MAGRRFDAAGSGKLQRSPSSSRTPSPDPDGEPARFRELLWNKPDLAGSIERWMSSLRARRLALRNGGGTGGVPLAGGAKSVGGSASGARSRVHGSHRRAEGEENDIVSPVSRTGSLRQCALVDPRIKACKDLAGRLPASMKGKMALDEGAGRGLLDRGGFPFPAQGCFGRNVAGSSSTRPAVEDYCSGIRLGRARSGSSGRSGSVLSDVDGAVQQRHVSARPPPFVVVDGMMRRPPLEPLKLFRGWSFVKHFTKPFKQSIEIPPEFWDMIPNRSTGSVIIFGDSIMGYPVEVDEIGDRCMFTHGWNRFVVAERISRYDTGVFAWLGSNVIGMRLYGPSGAERPHCRRPPIGHPMLEDFEGPPAHLPFGRPNVYVLRCILDMVFEIGAGVCMNGNVMQTLANVWHNEESSYPLFVCKITKSQVQDHGRFFFGSSFSKYLVNGTPAILLIEDSTIIHQSAVVFYPSSSGVARIVQNWNDFAVFSGLEAGGTYVVKIQETGGGVYRMSFFRSGGPI